MRRMLIAAGLCLGWFLPVCDRAQAQCESSHYVLDGTPAAQRDCQPMEAARTLSPDQMSAADREVIENRHAELAAAARFHGFDLSSPGWSYQQAVSPLLRKHLLLTFTNTSQIRKASRFTALIPMSATDASDIDSRVQIVPAFVDGRKLFEAGWKAKSTFAVFNRLVVSERGSGPINPESDWTTFAVLYLTLTGRLPSIPTETDSIKATWDLTTKRATTPVIAAYRNGSAKIEFSDLSDAGRVTDWKLAFDRSGRITKVSKAERAPAHVYFMQTTGMPQTVTTTGRP